MTAAYLYSNHANKPYSALEVCLENVGKSTNLRLINAHRVFQARQCLFSAGEAFQGLYILRSGSAKAFISSVEGDEHITKFFYPGDLLGLDGFDKQVHMHNVQFLETSSVCLLKGAAVSDLIKNSDDFRHCLLQSMSHSLVSSSSMMMCLSTYSSEQRVARFILELSEKFSSLGLCASQFRLSMTRTDIANYLGMALETVSRILTSFQLRNLVSIRNRHIEILNFDALYRFLVKQVSAKKMQLDAHTTNAVGVLY